VHASYRPARRSAARIRSRPSVDSAGAVAASAATVASHAAAINHFHQASDDLGKALIVLPTRSVDTPSRSCRDRNIRFTSLRGSESTVSSTTTDADASEALPMACHQASRRASQHCCRQSILSTLTASVPRAMGADRAKEYGQLVSIQRITDHTFQVGRRNALRH